MSTLVAGASDALDGALAKRFGWRSRTGALLDPLADKLLLCVGFLGLWLGGAMPGWLVALVFARDLIVRAYAHVAAKKIAITDDAQAVERLGHPIALLENTFPNPKLTHPADLAYLEFLLIRGEPAA